MLKHLLCLLALLLTLFSVSVSAAPNPVVVGSARFTVITPQCIRLEYAPDGKFVDRPSLFAADRAARWNGFRLNKSGAASIIDTGAIRLVYTPDGAAFSPANLHANIQKGSGTAFWAPGAPNPGNLGGTIRTLDGVRGPVDLGQGVLSRDGWFLFDDSRSPLLTADWVQARPESAGTDWYLFGYGDDYRAGLKSLTAAGGPVPLPRKYTLGAWYSRYWSYSSAEFRQIVDEYAAHDFPLDNMVMDMGWHKDGWTGWSWNKPLIPDPDALLSWFHEQGLHVTLNLHPADGVGPQEDAYPAFMRDMGADPASGKTLPFDAGSKQYTDTLFADVFAPLEKNGVDFWWLDWQQYPDTRSIPSLTNLFWLNTLLYDRTARDGQRGVSFSRWAGWGDHRHPIHFSGDAFTGFPMLAFEVPFTSTAGNVGCFFWSHDIGGHMGGRNDESYTRWVQFGAASPVLRSHSSYSADMDRRPWTYPFWAETSMRIAFHLRSEMFPYLYTSAVQSAQNTVPLNRPLYIDYGGKERAYHNAQEYLLGSNVLVAPIVSAGTGPGRVGTQTVWFPPGVWYNQFSGERYPGSAEALVAADINEFPLYVRGGVPLPMQPYQSRMATAPLTTLRVRCYPGEDAKTGKFTLYEDDGVTTAYRRGQSATTLLSYTRRGDLVTVSVGAARGKFTGQPARRAIAFELPNTTQAVSARVNGKTAAVVYDPQTQTNRIMVPARALSEATTVVVRTRPAGDAAQRTRAQQRRLAGVLGHPAATVQAALTDPALTPEQTEAVLAAGGVGLVRKNQGAYLYGGAVLDQLYAPSGLIDGNAVTAISGGAVFSAQTGMAQTVPGPEIEWRGRKIVQPGQVAFKIAGKTYRLPATLLPAGDLLSPDNVAGTAAVTASGSQEGYSPEGAVDGSVGGYPDTITEEWSAGATVGATLTLTWNTPQTINRIWLYDRPNTVDQITGGEITFSDGSTLPVDALPNDASKPLELNFPPKTVTSLTFKTLTIKPDTQNAGLSEIAVFRAK